MFHDVTLAKQQREELLGNIEEIETLLLADAFTKDLRTKSVSELAAKWLPGYEELSDATLFCLPQSKDASLREATRRLYKDWMSDVVEDQRTVVERMTKRAGELAAIGKSQSLFRGAFLHKLDVEVSAA
ncbi:MAG: hypothetical protein OEN23_04480 [Paracoccaceae bacterium]|nr:hypothetical protein [Paracoccaceae bacterium]